MKLEKIINGIRKFGVTRAVGIGLSSAVLMHSGGCEGDINQNALLGGLGAATLQNPNSTTQQRMIGAGAYTYGSIAGSQPQVNVNVNNNSNTQNTDKLWVYKPLDDYPNGKCMFMIKVAPKNPNDNGSVFFQGEVLKEDANGLTIRVSSGPVYYLPRSDIVEYLGCSE